AAASRVHLRAAGHERQRIHFQACTDSGGFVQLGLAGAAQAIARANRCRDRSTVANSIEDHLDQLAHHYSRSDNVPKALEYHERAGQQALQRSAYMDAMRGLTAALELLIRLPEGPERERRELDLLTTLGPV